ncbi:MAG: SCO family protein [Acidobacteriia bacterium]|nr:SCO family protein [Terriglobia bacterium]
MRLTTSTLLCCLALTGCAKRYRMEGMVVAVRPDPPTVTISHRAVAGFMPAMTMPFLLDAPSQLQGISPGARVQFDLVVNKARSRVRSLRLAAAAPADSDFIIPVAPEKLAVGSTVPDFELTDQLGRPTRLSGSNGKVRAINFIYTRCPLPEVCPRLSAAFASLQRRFSSDLMLLSVTLDPRHDRPPILARYAASLHANPDRWRFLTGSESSVTAVARSFGLVHWAEVGVIVHSSYTAIIDRKGRLAALVEGSSFPLEQLASLVQQVLQSGD